MTPPIALLSAERVADAAVFQVTALPAAALAMASTVTVAAMPRANQGARERGGMIENTVRLRTT